MNLKQYDNLGLDIQGKVVRHDGRRIQTYSIGSGENVILCLPPFPHSGIIYSLFMLKNVNPNTRLLTFDIPGWIGHSESNHGMERDPIEEMTEIAESVLSEYTITNFNLLGYSFGGAVAIHLANKDKNRIKRIALVSTIVNSDLTKGSKDSKALSIADKLKLHFFMRYYLKYRFGLYYKPLMNTGVPEEFLKMYKGMINTVSTKYVLESLKELFLGDRREELRNISDIPMLVVNSKSETGYFRKQAGCIRHILGDEKSIYMEGNHEDFLLYPNGETVKQVIRFLRQ
jgi:pimeloyl-ACP methyl ester carboxylesterase